MAIRDNLNDLADWWWSEIRQVFRRKSAVGPVFANLRIRRDGTLIDLDTDHTEYKSPDEVIEELRKRQRSRRGTFVGITVETGCYLRRQISQLRLPKSRHSAMAKIDMQAKTPFGVEDTFIFLRDRKTDENGSDYFLVKKSVLAPLVEALNQSRFSIGYLAFQHRNNRFFCDASSLLKICPRPRSQVISRGVFLSAWVLVLVSALGIVAHTHWRLREASAELDRHLIKTNIEANQVRTLIAARNLKISQLEAVRAERKDAVPIVTILEELSRILPDETWLTNINIDGNSVVFAGVSDSAASLVPVLEESDLFRAPTFDTSVVRLSDQSGERFTISLKVDKTTDG